MLPGLPGGEGGPPRRLVWDDRLWDEVWERQLGHVQRHTIAMEVFWRRRLPGDDLFSARVGAELARRWRRSARNFAIGYALWTLFWGALAYHMFVAERAAEPNPTLIAPVMAGLGLVAIGVCFGVRRRLAALARTEL